MRLFRIIITAIVLSIVAWAVEPLLYCPQHPGMICNPDGQHRTVNQQTYAHYTCVCGDAFWVPVS
jgi:hypothetical protein